MTTPPPGYLPPEHVPRHMNRGGLWLRIHRSDGAVAPASSVTTTAETSQPEDQEFGERQ